MGSTTSRAGHPLSEFSVELEATVASFRMGDRGWLRRHRAVDLLRRALDEPAVAGGAREAHFVWGDKATRDSLMVTGAPAGPLAVRELLGGAGSSGLSRFLHEAGAVSFAVPVGLAADAWSELVEILAATADDPGPFVERVSALGRGVSVLGEADIPVGFEGCDDWQGPVAVMRIARALQVDAGVDPSALVEDAFVRGTLPRSRVAACLGALASRDGADRARVIHALLEHLRPPERTSLGWHLLGELVRQTHGGSPEARALLRQIVRHTSDISDPKACDVVLVALRQGLVSSADLHPDAAGTLRTLHWAEECRRDPESFGERVARAEIPGALEHLPAIVAELLRRRSALALVPMLRRLDDEARRVDTRRSRMVQEAVVAAVRGSANAVLAQLVAARTQEERAPVGALLAKLGPDCVLPLVVASTQTDAPDFLAAATAIIGTVGHGASGALERVIFRADLSPAVSFRAVQILGRLAVAGSERVLLRALGHPSKAVAEAALDVLLDAPTPKTCVGVIGRLDDVDPALAARAVPLLAATNQGIWELLQYAERTLTAYGQGQMTHDDLARACIEASAPATRAPERCSRLIEAIREVTHGGARDGLLGFRLGGRKHPAHVVSAARRFVERLEATQLSRSTPEPHPAPRQPARSSGISQVRVVLPNRDDPDYYHRRDRY
jgi:hypothetical protein